MAEQRVDVRDVSAGGDVTVNPTQIITGSTGAATRGWTEALLRGSLEHVGLTAKAGAAVQLEEDGEPGKAAAKLLEIASELGARDYAPAAARYLSRAARLFEAAADRSSARDVHLELCETALGDGTPSAAGHAREASRLSAPDRRWQADAMLVLAVWPEHHADETAILDAALQASAGTGDELRWAARVVDHFRRAGQDDRARTIAETATAGRPIGGGPRLALELDLLDLLDGDAQDLRFAAVQPWLLDPTQPIAEVARAWQRRGVALTRRGDADGARLAFLQAIAVWSRDPGYDDQIAACYFGGLSARAVLGDHLAAFDDGRELAAALRGSKETAASRTERLLRRGLSKMAAGQASLGDAWWAFAAGVDEARRSGNFHDLLGASNLLGDCLAQAGHPAWALSAYVAAGDSAKAKALCGAFTADAVLQAVSLVGPRWERTAAWAALAGTGTNVSDEAAGRLAVAALEEHEREPASGSPTNAAYYALEVLGSIACAVGDDAVLARAIPLLRARMTFMVGDLNDLAGPFVSLTLTGRSDQSWALVEAFLDPDVHANISPFQIAELAEGRDDVRAPLIAAALAGHAGALEALAVTGDGLDGEPGLTEAAEARVQVALESEAIREQVEDGRPTLVQGMGGSLGPEGVYARGCDLGVREAFVDAILALLADPRLMVMTRAGAVWGLHNLGAALPASRVDTVADALRPLAVTPDVLADGDRIDHDEPLARFKVDLAPENVLRTAAIRTLARLGEEHPVFVDALRPAIEPALLSQSESLTGAALDAMALHPDVIPASLNLPALLLAPWDSVRVKTVGALQAVDDAAALSAAQQLVADPSSYVRRHMIGLAHRHGDAGRPLLESLANDLDCYIRARARGYLT